MRHEAHAHGAGRGTGAAAQAERTIEGADYAPAWLESLHAPCLRCVGDLLRMIGGRT